MTSALAIPEGHTFLNAETLITVQGKKLADKLLDDASKRDPDAFDMYIYNDFFSYGVLELVDSSLTSLHTKIVTKKWKEAYSMLEALVMFLNFESAWAQCDDGDRVRVTFKAVGASCIAVLRGIKTAGMLDPEHYPSLESVLQNMFEFSKEMEEDLGGKYSGVCKAIARRVLKEKTEADNKRHIEQLKEWVATLNDEEMKTEVKEQIKEISKKKKAGAKKVDPWYAKGKVVDEDYNGSDCKMTGVWKKYRDYLSECPRYPLRGPAEWDLSQWSAEEKMPFSFDAMDDI